MIPLSRQIHEKFAHETLDNSQMKKNSDNSEVFSYLTIRGPPPSSK